MKTIITIATVCLLVLIVLPQVHYADAFGNVLKEVKVDQQVQIIADLKNGQDRDQPFAYLV